MRAFKLIGTAFWTLIFIMHFTAEANADTINSLDFEGASITAGMKASLPLELRVRDHLSTSSAQTREAISQKKVLIALDYFFPTNFSMINDTNGTAAQFEAAIDAKILEWTRNNDAVIIGLLPDIEGLDEATREYLSSSQGSKFGEAYNFIKNCCSQKAAFFNMRVLSLAAAEPKIRVFDLSSVINIFRMNRAGGLRPSDIYADQIHLNDKGQAVLFNYALREQLAAVYGVGLSEMEVRNLTRSDVNRVWRALSLTPQDFAARKPGLYRAELMNEGLRNGVRYEGTVQNSDLNSRRLSLINNAVKGVSGESTTIPVEVRTDGSIVLDLIGALQFVPMPLQLAGDRRTYVGYGYDYWKMAVMFANLFSPSYYFGGHGGNAIGANYMFQISPKANAVAEMNLVWRVFPVLQGQAEVEDRLPVMNDRTRQQYIQNNYNALPHLTYRSTLKIVHE